MSELTNAQALELLLGTPNIFSVDQRTTALLTQKLQKVGATEHDIRRALYLASLSQFCIYSPNESWPMRHGDPLHNINFAKKECTMKDFHSALRARDILGLGFDRSSDPLLHLVSAASVFHCVVLRRAKGRNTDSKAFGF